MLLLNMNSKRQRRPNVRLGEIGDVPAAFACVYNHRTKDKPGSKRWRQDPMNIKQGQINQSSGFCKEKSTDSTESNSGVSPRILAGSDLYRENKNPNSSNSDFEFVNLEERDDEGIKTKLDFSNVTRKCRMMKRRGPRKMNDYDFLAGAWRSELLESSFGQGRACEKNGFMQFTADVHNHSTNSGFKDTSSHETPGTSKEACEYDVYEPSSDAWQQANFSDSKDDAGNDENSALPKPAGLWGSDVNSVSRWLDELGFGKYATLFEMHEVDEDVLPLLTLQDLKEMGLLAVGPRRKLYNAIQQLKSHVFT